MLPHRFAVLGCSALLLAGSAAAAEKPLDPRALAGRIDQLIGARLGSEGVEAAPRTDDAEFLRRVSLDLAGRIPRTSEVRAFLADTSPDKREKAIEKLLDGAFYSGHFARAWRAQILPDNNNLQFQFIRNTFEDWLRLQMRDNVRFDKLVRELLTTPVTGAANGRSSAGGYGGPANNAPLAYYQANEFKPENLAARTSRAFLGVNLECAQCHNHPFGSWTRQQFWEFAAFFAGIQGQGQNGFFFAGQEQSQLREIKIPDTTKTVQARFLDGVEPQFQTGVGSRQTLADWLTSPANPYFARNAANRLWAQLFGLGLVDPVDEFTDENPPSHPELLDEMAAQLVAHDFDMKYLLKALTLSETYQRQSVRTHPGQDNLRLFAKMAVKGMTPDQLFDSLAAATGYREGQNVNNNRVAVFLNGGAGARGEIVGKFASQDKKTEHQTSILQALALMNGRFIGDSTSIDRSEALSAVLDAPFLDDAQKIETLFLGTLSRQPTEDEAEKLVRYVQGGGPKNDARAALTDVFWALLNCTEFILNH